MRYMICTFLLGVVALSGCTATQKGAGIGALIGGGVGYAVGKQSGNDAAGAAIGATVGAIGGGLIGNKMEDKNMFICPECGRSFSSSVEYCPYDGTALKSAQ